MSKETFKLIFDKVEELLKEDNNLTEIEWEAIGGETTMMPYEWWEEMLPWALDRISTINERLENPGSLNFLTNLIYVDQRYTGLFNKHASHPSFCLYTSWEPDTNRFGARGQLYNRWKETLHSIHSDKKILDVILTKKVIELGADHLIHEFVPLGITDFSIKMLSAYGSGKEFFKSNMIDFESMRNFLIDLDKAKPAHITYTPQEEMLSSLYRGTSFQCNGNFKYDLSIEPDGATHFNANQTGDEAALGSRAVHLSDSNWARKVMLENKSEENAKLSLAHPECRQCKYMSYCNGGWYHYKIENPETIQKYSSSECPGYYGLWEYHEKKIGTTHSRSLQNHKITIKNILFSTALNSESSNEEFKQLSEFAGGYDRFLSAVNDTKNIICDKPRLYGKSVLELCWFFDDLRLNFYIPLNILSSIENADLLILHFVCANWSTVFINPEDIWRWIELNPENYTSKVIMEANKAANGTSFLANPGVAVPGAIDSEILIVDDRNDELFRWVIANKPVSAYEVPVALSEEEKMYIDRLHTYISRENNMMGSTR